MVHLSVKVQMPVVDKLQALLLLASSQIAVSSQSLVGHREMVGISHLMTRVIFTTCGTTKIERQLIATYELAHVVMPLGHIR